ncbi:MAG: NAD(P)H-dependent oxidoreductase subunit E [Gemmataceae bacterium]|nr:NAD(P)H-dependent oxidoreductase subunit E [Gemmataceae bacterium]
MDLHIHGPEATEAERAVVDAVVGEPAGDRRDLLLPALHAVQSRFGWLPQGALNCICRRLHIPPAEVYGVATFYHLLSLTPQPPTVVHVCDDIACRINGGARICEELAGRECPAHGGWKRSPCLGQCERAPAALVVRAGESPNAFVLPRTTSGAIMASLGSEEARENDRLEPLRRSAPQSGSPGLRLIRRIGQVDPESLEAYRVSGGYAALGRAFELGREGVVREVIASKLVGRGGAAFPTGRKWEAVAKAAVKPHYLVCNADESEPGAFKDRLLMEGDPFAVLEGMTIAGYATGCEKGFIYLRGEYPLAARRMATALAAGRAAGLLGSDILGKNFAFDVEIRRGAGAYVCGEETALFNSIEGKRGEPRNKPPFPVEVGLFGKPTVINNVETLVNVPPIILEGGAAYTGIGTAGSSGPKLFCLSGHVAQPGLYEVAFGPTLREAIALAGGVSSGRPIRAVLLGGAAGAFVGPDQLDMPLTLEGARAAGASLGSGVIMVFDDSVDLGDILARIAAFFRAESCGQCVPCRVGAIRQEELLARLRAGKPIGSRRQELALLQEIGQAMRDASICGLGQTASTAIESALASLDPVPEQGRPS